ncbi:MAG: J domain-containing protein [Myxococcota bacterium]
MSMRKNLITSLTTEEQDRVLGRYNQLNTLDNYQLLEVGPEASKQDIQRAYQRLSRHWHPEHFSPRDPGEYRVYLETIAASIRNAHEVLTDNRARSQYDRELLAMVRPMTPPKPSLPAPAPASSARFESTADLLAYGAKLGVGKAVQDQSLKQLRKRFPEQTALLDNPAVLSGVKMALPFIGLELAQRLKNPDHAQQVRDASQGMLLVNTIDATSDVTQHVAGQLLEVGQFLLQLFGVHPDQADEGARQLLQDFGVTEDLLPTTAAKMHRS